MVQTKRPMSFELNEEMLKLLGDEFGAQVIAAKFAEAVAGKKGAEIEAASKSLFEEYGREFGQRTVQLGQEYSDRTWETLQAAADSTGTLKFGLFPQRFLEIAYLATQDISTLPILECWSQRLVYHLVECSTYKLMKEKAGEEAVASLPCRHGCLALVEAIHQELGIDAAIEMTADMNKDARCEFTVRKI
jgi:hypothetical protein